MLTIGEKHLRKRYKYPNNINDIYSKSTSIWPYITETFISSKNINLEVSSTTISSEGGEITLYPSASITHTSVWVNYEGVTSNYRETYNIEAVTPSISTSLGTINGNILTIPKNSTAVSRSIVVTASYEDSYKNITITQEATPAPTITSYGDWTVSIAATPTSVPYSGGSSTISVICFRTVTWSDESTTYQFSDNNINLSTNLGSLSSTSVDPYTSTSTLTLPSNSSTSIKTATITATCEGKSKSCTVTIQAAPAPTITSYGSWYLYISTDHTAVVSGGGTATITVDCYRPVYWSDENTTYEQYNNDVTLSVNSGGSLSPSSVTGNYGTSTLTITKNTTTSYRTITVTAYVTIDGKTLTDACDITQLPGEEEPPTITSYGDWTLDLTASPTSLSESGGNTTITVDCFRYRYWSDGSRDWEWYYGNITLSTNIGKLASTSVKGNYGTTTLTVESNSLTSSRTITVQGSGTVDGKSVKDSVNITQGASTKPTITNYGEWVLSLTANSTEINVGGGSSTITASCSRQNTWSDNSKTTEYSSSNIVLSTDLGSLSSTSISANSGTSKLTLDNNTSIDSRTATVKATCQGKSQEVKITQSGVTDYITEYGIPTISISDGLTAAKSSATITASVKNKYYSGEEKDGTVTLAITTNGNNRFSLSGNTLSHSSMTTNAVTDTVVVTAYNAGDNTKTKTASKSIENKVISTSTKQIESIVGFSYDSAYGAKGSTTSPKINSVNARVTDTYTSGSTSDRIILVTASKRYTINSTTYFNIDPSTGICTTKSDNTDTSSRSATVTLTASYGGKSKTATATVTQDSFMSVLNVSFERSGACINWTCDTYSSTSGSGISKVFILNKRKNDPPVTITGTVAYSCAGSQTLSWDTNNSVTVKVKGSTYPYEFIGGPESVSYTINWDPSNGDGTVIFNCSV